MKTNLEVTDRIEGVKAKLQLIEEAKRREMQKPFFKRRYPVLHLLYFERNKYEFALRELEWFLAPRPTGPL